MTWFNNSALGDVTSKVPVENVWLWRRKLSDDAWKAATYPKNRIYQVMWYHSLMPTLTYAMQKKRQARVACTLWSLWAYVRTAATQRKWDCILTRRMLVFYLKVSTCCLKYVFWLVLIDTFHSTQCPQWAEYQTETLSLFLALVVGHPVNIGKEATARSRYLKPDER